MKMKWNYGKEHLFDCFFVRKKVFVIEQGFSEELEFDAIDNIAHHLCIYNENEEPIATARLFCEKDVYHCGRICIIKEYRGTGLGEIIMKALEEKARELNAAELELSAQVRVKPFYEKAGYQSVGAEYMDEHCPHIRMIKHLN
ncbi:GNAT family N-acetyltransferase [Paludicola sp. MB14-C6]|uniref:GNAT family N-acetyltransferase n=1 Tax=Paludihabitans sp. MB14-C6 TaxID=3070656 RepID=UPI0027DB31A5|nr:GNAT family N-acetyltransferase [Paludicola sp. MB14-C6]WMJ22013.1 GNAT family N-acetyltransferase [Paludicola sp. MB14-C6]